MRVKTVHMFERLDEAGYDVSMHGKQPVDYEGKAKGPRRYSVEVHGAEGERLAEVIRLGIDKGFDVKTGYGALTLTARLADGGEAERALAELHAAPEEETNGED